MSDDVHYGVKDDGRVVEVHDSDLEPEITTLYAILATDEDGGEGIMSRFIPGVGHVPMVFGRERLAAQMGPIVEDMLTVVPGGKRARLVKFTSREVIREFGES